MTQQTEQLTKKENPNTTENSAAGELKSTGCALFILLLSLVSVFNLLVDWINFIYPNSELTLT